MSQFPAVHLEGGLLGPDILEELLAGELPGQKSRDFGLDGKRALTDEIAAAFADAREQWKVFQHRLERVPDTDLATSVTRDAWMIPFLSLLGYELHYNQRAYDVDGASFAISHRAGEVEDAPPVHLVGARQELGRLPPSGRPRLAPHSLIQEFLNRTEHLWGLVTNGLTLRLLRNCTYIRRQAYIEFDLRQILDEQRFNDFALLYRLLHRTRLPRSVQDAHECLLEQYHKRALEQGGRVRDRLRDGVEQCIKLLANGFLAHPANTELRQRLASYHQRVASGGQQTASGLWPVASGGREASVQQRAASGGQRAVDEDERAASGGQQTASGEWRVASGKEEASVQQRAASGQEDLLLAARGSLLAPEELYRQLLRLVYRLLFLLVSEDRGLISPNPIYREHYGIARLRRLLDNRHAYDDHEDLWCSLRVLWKVLADEKLAPILEVAPLNGELFAPLDLDACSITNRDFLEAFWHLAYYRESPSAPPRRVNYAALDVEELGSVYESLLEYHPVVMASGERRAASSGQQMASGLWPVASGKGEASGQWPGASSLRFELIFGSERKSTGSYYTPPELVAELIRSALEPVLTERLASSERRAASSDASVLTLEEKHYVYSVLSRPAGLAERYGTGSASLSPDPHISEGGSLRHDRPDSPSSGLRAGEHSGGMGTTVNRAVPAQRPRESSGVGNLSAPGHPPEVEHQRPGSTTPGTMPAFGSATDQPPAQPYEEKRFLKLWSRLPLAARRSLLAEHALLSMRILDPACGSGHFLLAAARRLGKELARIRTDQEEPAPEVLREAIRDVVAHCIYGVDKNPLAVELCRVALWLEAHCAGKPLTFLDHRIKCGDSLVGILDLDLLTDGIPDDAFAPTSSDTKQTANALKKQNRDERRDLQSGQLQIPFDLDQDLEQFGQHQRLLGAIRDDAPETVRQKKTVYDSLQADPHYRKLRQGCHLWTAAFFQQFTPSLATSPTAITTRVVIDHLAGRTHPQAAAAAEALAQQQHFFHWPLEFPEVFVASGEQRAASGQRRAVDKDEPAASGGQEGTSAEGQASGQWRVASGGQETAGSQEDLPLAARRSLLADPGFDVILSNPPFMGGLKISGNLGHKYRHWLDLAFAPFKGTADLCAAFYRRAFSLLRPGGRMGLVATNTIGQGDTRESGLAVILHQGGTITFAKRFLKWPGAANVEVNLVAIEKQAASSELDKGTSDHHSPLPTRYSPILDGQPVPAISSRLDADPEAEPVRLKQNEGKAFQGSIVLGMGFVLEPDEAKALIAKDPRNADCLFPYLNGEDLNSHPEQQPSRWVINFFDWDLEHARLYPELIQIVESKVKPEREQLRDSIPTQAKRKKFWWQYGSAATQLYRAIAPLRRVLVRSRVSELHMLAFVPKGYVYGDATIVFAFDDDYHFALLQSGVHEVWVWRNASSLESRNRYTPTDCFDTFPFPSAAKQNLAADALPGTSQPAHTQTDYLDDAAVVCLLLDELRRRQRPADEFTLQKHAFIAKEKLSIPLRSQFERKAAGPWSHDLRYRAIHAGEKRRWLRWENNRLVPAASFSKGVEYARVFLGDKAARLAELVQDLQGFGRSGLERWTTVLKIVSDMRMQGRPITLDAIQAQVDAWPEKRLKELFTEESVEYTVRQMVRQGWIQLDETKPRISPQEQAARLGGEYHEHRRQIMLARGIGLTKTYNLFHDPACQDAEILRLRELHAEMDRAILACYGWDDLEPGHDFYQNDRGQTRYTLSPAARREVLARLLGLNLEIAGREK